MSDETPINATVTTRMLRFREVHARTQLSRVTIWRMERRGDFPARRQLSTNSVGWIEREVEEWLLARRVPHRRPAVQPADPVAQRRGRFRDDHRRPKMA